MNLTRKEKRLLHSWARRQAKLGPDGLEDVDIFYYEIKYPSRPYLVAEALRDREDEIRADRVWRRFRSWINQVQKWRNTHE